MKNIDHFDNFISLLENTMKEYRDIKTLIEKNNLSEKFEDVQKTNELAMLLTIANSDLTISLKNLYLVKNDSEKLFFVKNIFLTIHETIVSYQANGKFINNLCQTYDATKDEYKIVTDNLRKFKKDHDYERYIIPMRNSISAHIDIDSFYDETIQIDIDKILKITSQFGQEFLSTAISLVKILLKNLMNNFLSQSSL